MTIELKKSTNFELAMKTNAFDLFVEINDKNFIFVVGSYDEIHNLKIIEKTIVENDFFNKKFKYDSYK